MENWRIFVTAKSAAPHRLAVHFHIRNSGSFSALCLLDLHIVAAAPHPDDWTSFKTARGDFIPKPQLLEKGLGPHLTPAAGRSSQKGIFDIIVTWIINDECPLLKPDWFMSMKPLKPLISAGGKSFSRSKRHHFHEERKPAPWINKAIQGRFSWSVLSRNCVTPPHTHTHICVLLLHSRSI